MTQIRILYLAHYFPPFQGVAGINTYEIVRRLLERGHQVVVVAPSILSRQSALCKKLTQTQNRLRIRRSFPLPVHLSLTISHLLDIKETLDEEFDVVVSQCHPFHFASVAGFVTQAIKDRPWVVKVHDFVIDSTMPRPLYEKMYLNSQYHLHLNLMKKYADKVLVHCHELQHFLVREAGFSTDKISLNPNGVDMKLFKRANGNKETKEKVILYIGSMFAEDGLDVLIKGFALLRPNPWLRLVLIGDGPDKGRLKEMVTAAGLVDQVSFQSNVPHDLMPDIIKSSYVAIGPLHSTIENYFAIPTKILEYFACGVPVISCKVSSDVLVDNYTGLVLSNPTPKEVAERISLLASNEELAKRLGSQAHEVIVNKFQWDVVINSLENELEEVMKK